MAAGTCTGLAVGIEGTLDDARTPAAGNKVNWAPIPLAGSATIAQTDVPAGECRVFAVPAGFGYLHATRATVTSCTASVSLSLNP